MRLAARRSRQISRLAPRAYGGTGVALLLGGIAALGATTPAGAAVKEPSLSYLLKLPDRLDRGPIVFRQGDHRIAMTLLGARGKVSTKDGVADVAEALPGVRANYATAPRAFKESLVLAGPTATSTFRYRLRTSGDLDARLGKGGAIDFVSGGRRVLQMPAPFMFDSRGGSPATSRAITVRLRRVRRTEHRLTLSPSRSWLASKRRVWPVVVDPTVTDIPQTRRPRLPRSTNCGRGTRVVRWVRFRSGAGAHTRRASVSFPRPAPRGRASTRPSPTARSMRLTRRLAAVSQPRRWTSGSWRMRSRRAKRC